MGVQVCKPNPIGMRACPNIFARDLNAVTDSPIKVATKYSKFQYRPKTKHPHDKKKTRKEIPIICVCNMNVFPTELSLTKRNHKFKKNRKA